MAVVLDTLEQEKSAPAACKLRVRTATSLDELEQLEAAWRQLDQDVSYPLVRYDWMRAALAIFAAEGTPHIIAVLRGDEAVALAPLATKRLHGVSRWVLAGVSEVFEPANLLWSDERGLNRLIAAVARRRMPLVLERIPALSPALAKLKRRYWGRAVVITRPQATSPYIALDETWLTPEQHLNSGRRSDLRRARRKAEQLGPVTTEIHAPDLNDLAGLLDRALEVESRSWKGETGIALSYDATRAAFYRQYAQAACTDGILRICFLRIGEVVAAMQLAIEDCSGFWLLKVGYDARYSQCSPGLLLMRETIRYAVEAGLTRYEFLGRSEAWTKVWTETEHPYVTVRVYPLGLRGLAALAVDAMAHIHQTWSRSSATR